MSPVAEMAVSGHVLESGPENFLHRKKRERMKPTYGEKQNEVKRVQVESPS